MTHTGTEITRYHANNPSAAVPDGFGDEELIADILAEQP